MSDFWQVIVPGYGTALGTIGLAGFAAYSVHLERQQRQELKEERDVARAETRKLQAEIDRRQYVSAVSCYRSKERWDGELVSQPKGDPPFFMARGHRIECAVVDNDSGAPIRDVMVRWVGIGNGGVGEIDDTKQTELLPLQVVPAKQKRAMTRPRVTTDWDAPIVFLEIEFTDVNEVRWSKNSMGAFNEIEA